MNRDLKIGFLWLGSPGYIINCAGNLASDVESVIFFYVDGVLPRDILASYQRYIMEKKLVLVDVTNISAVELKNRILDADLHALVICGWHYRKWIKAAKGFSGIKILTLDNQWKGNVRQILGKVYGRTYLRRNFHSVFVPGARSRVFAEKIGFDKSKVHEGLYVGNNRIFNPPSSESRQDFLFPGRLIAEKNVEELLHGYQEYRRRVTNPWNLKIAGWGPLESKLMNQLGIDFLGKLSQVEMAEAMRTSKFTILPSLSERWGVVVHESVLVGTPVICSEECGAADYFVIDKNSGFLLSKPSVKNIADALYDAHMQSELDYEAMSKACFDLAGCFTPEIWSKTIIQMICEHTKTWKK
jgi:glycosyltransferase involved in cell wall biosynthesis